MYCIVFSGRLLDGYDPQSVRKAVATRLRLDAKQVDRLFCGQRVILKKGVTEDSGRLYLSVLQRLGLDAGMARIPQAAETVQALATFKVVFWGRTIEGFDRAAVMQAAVARLKVKPAQIDLMFNGGKSVLKRGLSAEAGSRYVVELARIGMQIDLEVETIESAAKVDPIVVPAQLATAARVVAVSSLVPRQVGFRRHGDDDAYSALLQTQFELPGTAGDADDFQTHPKAAQAFPIAESSFSAALPPAPQARQSVSNVKAAHAAKQVVPSAPESPIDSVRCEQCGHRQTLGVRCRVCGTQMQHRSPHTPIRMDASAYSSHTTVLGNMPSMLSRGDLGATPPRDDLSDLMRIQSDKYVSAPSTVRFWGFSLVGVAMLLTLVALLLFVKR
jgi:hypothetical protein